MVGCFVFMRFGLCFTLLIVLVGCGFGFGGFGVCLGFCCVCYGVGLGFSLARLVLLD